MELLLKKNVDNLGMIGDIVKVKEGYARNYLLPRGLATTVSPANVKQIEKEKIKMTLQLKEENERLRGVLDKIAAASCIIPAKANEEGKLFGSVTSAQIAEALAKEGYPVDKEMVKLDNPIKVCGVYDVVVAVNMELQTKCKVTVVNEDAGQPEDA
ncbi:MAG: LSU ribosomal protein L9p [Candidatus Jettenia ecosi]|uniref:Large ribosomal subunit protein bL9 n=1 Tax=Candidatus Jettenia ecosi TaxID=2494326 RepID=A0A533Q7I3_9BACT|nr:MAG: LSU ribosomal protein L9p [Candidatus Jettenia ecosi]